MKYKYVVVGSGLSGLTMAERIANDLDSSVISRIPFRFNHDTRYFEDKYQGIPEKGYTKCVKR